MSKKATGIVSYITIIGWLIAYLAGDKEGAKFHLNQSLVLNIASTVLTIAAKVLKGVPLVGIVISILDLIIFILWVIGFIYAIKEEEKEIPILGSIKIL